MATTVAGALAGTALVIAPTSAGAAPAVDVLLAEVYGGGGNSGASLTNDFIEVANKGSAAIAVDGWSVQYLPAAPKPTSQWQVTPLTGAVAPGGRYLIGEAKGTGGTLALPAPDATGAINMSGTGGTVALVRGTTALTCLTAADCLADARMVDVVGYGDAVVREGTPATGAANAASVARTAALADTDDNGADFAAGAPTPINARGQGPVDPGPGPDPEPTNARIHDIQGTTRLSPKNGARVTGVPGVVTGIRAFGNSRGFWFQDTLADDDPRTSEGVFVLTGGVTPAVAVGDAVKVTGKVEEFYPGGANIGGQSLTQLTGATWAIEASGQALPAPVPLDAATVPDAYVPSGTPSIEALALEPGKYALDLYESLEGQLTRVADTRVVGPSTSFGELWVTVEPTRNPTAQGGTVYSGYDAQNGGRLKVSSLIPFAQEPFPKADVGDTLTGVTTGPLTYDNFGGYTLAATTLGKVAKGGLTPESTRDQKRTELAVATYNVENLSPKDDQAKFDRLAKGIVTNLATPDVVALEEIQDNTGPTNDGVVAADQTLDKLVAAIKAAGGPTYSWRSIEPVDGKDGGQPGGNIRNAFLFDATRVEFVDRPGGGSTTAVGVRKDWLGRAQLTQSPGRVAPADAAWENSRKPLAAEFRFRGKTVFVVANHFASKGGDQALDSRFQPPTRSSEVQRVAQAKVLRGFVDELLGVDPRANLVVLGDLNDFAFSPTLNTLTAGGALRTMVNTLPANERWGYVFNGNSQMLDHILTSPRVTRFEYDIVHVNAAFADQASDHDPQILRVHPSTGSDFLDCLEQLWEELTDRS
ncbi:endonuclease/exonuclease/phosphatase family protein [Embleya sp. NBC_00896]|uniref:endonuclease/exonuclease/phosphatase family protein n=1 Tax=Embleya sp. NBC_00896 TaxID=2975961 RepID=UPI003864972B|nr:endonuclease/exonuclease/phosphatase family protein [Embleya sp. NBC_00896]